MSSTPGTLFVVATPIGNLEDLTLRAIRILKGVDVVACEDTRHTRVLLAHYGIAKPLVSYHGHNERQRTPELVRRLRDGASIALVSDAGMPALSDPGYVLVREAAAHEIPVVAVPGPSAVTAALAVSGLPSDRFLFLGFLPRKSGERRRVLDGVAVLPYTLVIFEAPHRLRGTIKDLQIALGDRQIAVTRELTKRFEEVVRGTIGEVEARVDATEPRGEFTIVVEGAGGGAVQPPASDPEADLRALIEGGTPAKDAVQIVARHHHIARRDAYQLMLQITGKRRPLGR